MFCVMGGGGGSAEAGGVTSGQLPQYAIDFWWVKPQAEDPNQLERATLPRQTSGPHKNDPGIFLISPPYLPISPCISPTAPDQWPTQERPR